MNPAAIGSVIAATHLIAAAVGFFLANKGQLQLVVSDFQKLETDASTHADVATDLADVHKLLTDAQTLAAAFNAAKAAKTP